MLLEQPGEISILQFFLYFLQQEAILFSLVKDDDFPKS